MATKTKTPTANVPATHPLAFPPVSAPINNPALGDYNAQAAEVVAETAEVLADYADLLGDGMLNILSDTLDRYEELETRRVDLNRRIATLKPERFTVAAAILPEVVRFAEQARGELDKAIDAEVVKLGKAGVTAAAFSTADADSGAAQLRNRAAIEPAALAAKERSNLAQAELTSVRALANLAGAKPAAIRNVVTWPVAQGDAAVVQRMLAAANPTAPVPVPVHERKLLEITNAAGETIYCERPDLPMT